MEFIYSSCSPFASFAGDVSIGANRDLGAPGDVQAHSRKKILDNAIIGYI